MATATSQAPLTPTEARTIPATAQGSDAEFVTFVAPVTGTITAVGYAPVAAINGADTNTRKLELFNRKADGSGVASVASVQFNAGVNASQYVQKALTLSGTAANLDVTAGDVLTFKSTHVGTGLADPGGMVAVTFSRA